MYTEPPSDAERQYWLKQMENGLSPAALPGAFFQTDRFRIQLPVTGANDGMDYAQHESDSGYVYWMNLLDPSSPTGKKYPLEVLSQFVTTEEFRRLNPFY